MLKVQHSQLDGGVLLLDLKTRPQVLSVLQLVSAAPELARPSRRTRRFLLFSERRCSSHMSCLLSHSSRSREERSPSVEIIYEGPVGSNATQPPAHKRHRKGGHRSRAGRYRCSSTGGQQRAAFQQNLTSSHGSAG